MMPRAEVALVIAAIGTKMGIVDVALLSITVLIVIVTSLITPLLIKIAFKGYPRVSYLE
jgi:Kef-type K+ transport system membrane component KefB